MDGARVEGRVAGQDGWARGLHCFRISRQQRAHLATLLTVVLLATVPAFAQQQIPIDFDPAITQEDFRTFSLIVAQGIFASPVQPAGASGLLRFDIGLAATGVEIDPNAEYW